MEKIVYTPSEVAKLLHIRPQTVYTLLENGTIPALRLNTRWKIPISAFNEWMKSEELARKGNKT